MLPTEQKASDSNLKKMYISLQNLWLFTGLQLIEKPFQNPTLTSIYLIFYIQILFPALIRK